MPDFPNLDVGGGGYRINDLYTDISPQALGQLVDYVTQSGIPIPVSQIVGFSQTIPQRAIIAANETTTSTTFVDLTTAGPTISGLSNGKYLVIVSAYMSNTPTAGFACVMSPSFNGSTPTDQDGAITSQVQTSTCAGITVATLSSGSNSVKAQYRVNQAGQTGTFLYRNLIVIRMGNA